MTGLAWFFYPHRILVKDVDAGGGMGATYTPRPDPVPAEVLDELELRRDRDAAEHASGTTVTVDVAAAIAPGALVTVWPGTPQAREAKVLRVRRDENPPLLPSHLILQLE